MNLTAKPPKLQNGVSIFRGDFLTAARRKTKIIMDVKIKTVPAVKAGRCYNGFHKNRGVIVHAVPPLLEHQCGYWGNEALCGTTPSGRSYGWDNTKLEVNCPKCIKNLNQINSAGL